MFLIAAKPSFSQSNSSTDFSLCRKPLRESVSPSLAITDSVQFGMNGFHTPPAAQKVGGKLVIPENKPKFQPAQPATNPEKPVLSQELIDALKQHTPEQETTRARYSPPTPRAYTSK